MSLANQQSLATALGLIPAEQATDAEPEQDAPDFDGGPRESAPLPADAEAVHNELVGELLGRMSAGGGGA